MKRKKMILNADRSMQVFALTDEEAGKVIKAIFRLACYGEDTDFSDRDRIVRATWETIKLEEIRDLMEENEMYKPKEMDTSSQLLRLFDRICCFKTLMETTGDIDLINFYQAKIFGMLEAACVIGIICPDCEAKIIKDIEDRHLWACGNCPIDNAPENVPIGH